MEWYLILFYILFACFGVGMIGFSIWYSIRSRKSIIDRARKIDPTVKNIVDAGYVLEKDIAQNVGKNKD